MSRTGVVVVTYNSAEVIGACLDSCASLPAVVVDNASQDDTIDQVRRHPEVQLIPNAVNLGFAAAVNQGVAALATEFVLVLNPDVCLKTPVDALSEACAQPGAGVATGRLFDPSGSPQSGFNFRRFPTPASLSFEVLGLNRIFPWNPINRRYRCLGVDLSMAAEVEQPPGAFLMFRRQVWEQLGGFDTQFHPLWFEDVDFCKRASELGIKIMFVPSVAAMHRGGHTVAQLNWASRELYWYVSLLRYASKHFRPYALRVLSAAVMLGSVLRAVAGTTQMRSFKPISVYAKVIRLAVPCMISGRMQESGGLPGYSKAVG
jgi:N-acetylglucosaminyl-diphospho-decaprenol L-rhamnosyltransferase